MGDKKIRKKIKPKEALIRYIDSYCEHRHVNMFVKWQIMLLIINGGFGDIITNNNSSLYQQYKKQIVSELNDKMIINLRKWDSIRIKVNKYGRRLTTYDY